MTLQPKRDWSLAAPADMEGLHERGVAVLGCDGIPDGIESAVNPVASS